MADRLMWRSCCLLSLATCAWVLAGCAANGDSPGPDAATEASLAAATAPTMPGGPVFAERAAELGLRFQHDAGVTGEYYYPETLGAGAAWLDYDGDGDLDAYLVQGGPIDGTAGANGGGASAGGLFRNELAETGRLAFTDVTAGAGLARVAYGQGVTTGDHDNDGDVDLYLSNYGPNQLLRNDGDGHFTDVTAASGVEDARWSSGASFVDYDRDGWLDLFVANYVHFDPGTNKPCYSANGARDYCGPLSYRAAPDRLFHNRGDGTFEDVSSQAGISAADGAGFSALALDVAGDGWPDIFVANDASANQLWRNTGLGRFEDVALVAGVAVNGEGQAEASMGSVAEDADGDLDWDLFLSHLTGEHNTLYVNLGEGLFEDRSMASGLGGPSLPLTGYGLGSLDWDADGAMDFAVVNGAMQLEGMAIGQAPVPGDPLGRLRQPGLLYRGLGAGAFEDATARAGAAFAEPVLGRGLAVGDADNDGDPDLLAGTGNGPARLYLNQLGSPGGWLGLRLVDPDRRRDALGAEVTVTLTDGRRLLRRAHTDGSVSSARDPRVLVGLGGALVARLDVRWPDGSRAGWEWVDQPVNRYVSLARGVGPTPDAAAPYGRSWP